jgi:nucleotide-binding universal stress UspA family protein
MIYLAYDGSLNAEWVSRYAFHLAAHSPGRALTLIHVEDGSLDRKELDRKAANLRRECNVLGVALSFRIQPVTGSIRQSLLQTIPAGRDNLTVCGTRVRAVHKPFLAGSITEHLLHDAPFPVLAVRVVQPGLLGVPRDLLLPLAGHPRGITAAWPFFHLLSSELETVHLLRGMMVSTFRLRHLSGEQFRGLREQGARYLAAVTEEIRRGCPAATFRLDSRIVICDDWVREILVHASRLKSRLILLGASQRPLFHQMLHGQPLERVLRGTPCDIGIYRWP